MSSFDAEHNRKTLEKYDKIVTFQFAKVASSSIWKLFGDITKRKEEKPRPTKERTRVFGKSYHTHLGTEVQKLLDQNNKILVINITRNLFDKNISDLFQQIDHPPSPYYLDTSANILERYSVENIMDHFYRKNTAVKKHRLARFYSVLQELLQLNIFSEPFDFDRKFLFFQEEKFDLLIIRFEDLRYWGSILEEALNLKNITIPREHISDRKWYGSIYKEFKAQYHYSEEEIRMIMDVDFMNYFYTADEIASFMSKY